MIDVCRNFDYIKVGGICISDTNIYWMLSVDTSTFSDIVYIKSNGMYILNVSTNGYIEVDFGSGVDANIIDYVDIICCFSTVSSDNKFKVKWYTSPNLGPEFDTSFEKQLDNCTGNFCRVTTTLKNYTGWRGTITSMRFYFPEFVGIVSIKDIKLITVDYYCKDYNCPYRSNYVHPCIGSYYCKDFKAATFPEDNFTAGDNEVFEIELNDTIYSYVIDKGVYSVLSIVDTLNAFLDTLPIGTITFIISDYVTLHTTCHIDTLIISNVLIWLGFFDGTGAIYSVTINNYKSSNYIDVLGNKSGIYRYTPNLVIDTEDTYDDAYALIPVSAAKFVNKTVIFKELVIPISGVYNTIHISGKVTNSSKVIIYERIGNNYIKKDVYNITDNVTGIYDFVKLMWLNKGDIVGLYNVVVNLPINTDYILAYYYSTDGVPTAIPLNYIDNLIVSNVGLSVHLEFEYKGTIPVCLMSSRISYIDGLYFEDVENVTASVDLGFLVNSGNYNINVGCDNLLLDTKDSIIVNNNSVDISVPNNITCSLIDYVDGYVLYKLSDTDVYKCVIKLESIFDENIDAIEMYECDSNYVCTLCDIFKPIDEQTSSKLGSDSDSESNVTKEYYIDISNNLSNFKISFRTNEGVSGADVTSIFNYTLSIYAMLPMPPKYSAAVSIENNESFINSSGYTTIGQHLKELNLVVDNYSGYSIDLSALKVVSNRVPYFYECESDQCNLTVFNTHNTGMECSINGLSSYSSVTCIDALDNKFNLIYYQHDAVNFFTNQFIYTDYTLYSLRKLLYNDHIFNTDVYKFSEYSYDWYIPYDINIASYDGEFVYKDNSLYIIPTLNIALRWFNFINNYIYSGDFTVKLDFEFLGNTSSYALIGIQISDTNYDNYLVWYVAYEKGGGYGIDYKLAGDDENNILNIVTSVGSRNILVVNRKGGILELGTDNGGVYSKLKSIQFVNEDVHISISTIYSGDDYVGNILAKIHKVSINYTQKIAGKKIYYSIDDINTAIFNGNLIDSQKVYSNLSQVLSLPGGNDIRKFVYKFGKIKIKYLKLVAVNSISLCITELMFYKDKNLVKPLKEYVSYNSDYINGKLESISSYLLDGCIINTDLSYSIDNGSSYTLGSVGVEFDSLTEVDELHLFYEYGSGQSAPRLLYSYDNITYYDVFDNFSLFDNNTFTQLHFLFNDYSGYRAVNEIRHDFTSEQDYSTDFTQECFPNIDYKWTYPSNWSCESKGVRINNSSMYSDFYIDGDFDIDLFYYDVSGVNDNSYVYLYVYFGNDTSYGFSYVGQRMSSSYRTIYYRYGGSEDHISKSKLRTYEGGLRLSRIGSTIYWKYREGMTTWVSVGNLDYGSDYVYPVRIRVSVVNCTATVNSVKVSSGYGIGAEDVSLLECSYDNSLFVRGANIPTTNSSSNVYVVFDKICYYNVNSFLSTIFKLDSIPSDYTTIVYKQYNFYIETLSGKPSYTLHGDYSYNYLHTSSLITGTFTNSFLALSIYDNNIDSALLQTPGNTVVLSYNSVKYGDVIFDTDFNYTHSGLTLTGPGSYIDSGVFKMEYTSVLKNTNVIQSSAGLVVECSITFNTYDYYYSNQRYRAVIGISDHNDTSHLNTSHRTVYILHNYKDTYLRVYINGYYKGYLCDITLNHTYLFSVKFMDGRVVVSWNGLTRGAREFGCSNIYGNVYVWSGSYTGLYSYVSSYHYYYTLHRFLCRRTQNEVELLKDNWLLNVPLSDTFGGSDNRLPNGDRWYISGDPRTKGNTLLVKSNTLDEIKSKYYLYGEYILDISYYGLEYTTSLYSGFYVKLYKYDTIFRDVNTGNDTVFIGYISESGIEVVVNGNTTFYNIYTITSGIVRIETTSSKINIYFYDSGVFNLLVSVDSSYKYRSFSIYSTGDAAKVNIDNVEVICDNAVSEIYPYTNLQLEPYYDQRDTYYAYRKFVTLDLSKTIGIDNTYNIDFNVFTESDVPWWFIAKYTPPSGFSPPNKVTNNDELYRAISDGGVYYIYPHTYDISGKTFSKDILFIGVGNFNDIRLNIYSFVNIKYESFIYFYNISVYNYLSDNNTGYGLRINSGTLYMDNCYCTCPNFAPFFNTYGSGGSIYLYNTKITNVNYMVVDDAYLVLFPIKSVIKYTYNIVRHNNDNVKAYLYKTSDYPAYEPVITDKVVIWSIRYTYQHCSFVTLIDETIDLGMVSNKYEYISIGNSTGNFYIYTSGLKFYFFSRSIDSSYTNGEFNYYAVVDTINIDSNFMRSTVAYANADAVRASSIEAILYYNGVSVFNYMYTTYNKATNCDLRLGMGIKGLIDEFKYDIVSKPVGSINDLYINFLSKFNYSDFYISSEACKYRFYIDLGSPIGVDKILFIENKTFIDTLYYSDNVDNPLGLSNVSGNDVCRWVVFEDTIGSGDKSVGIMSMYPDINKSDSFVYIGGYYGNDIVPFCVIECGNYIINDIYNVVYTDSCEYSDYVIIKLDSSITIVFKFSSSVDVSYIRIASGVRIADVFQGMITDLNITIGEYKVSYEDLINSTLDVDIFVKDVLEVTVDITNVVPVDEIVVDNIFISGNYAFINYISIFYGSSVSSYNNNICYAVELPLLYTSSNILTTTSCSNLDYLVKGVPIVNVSELYTLVNKDDTNVNIKSLVIYKGSYDNCDIDYNGITVDVPNGSICSNKDVWYIVYGDGDVVFTRFYAEEGNTGSVGISFYKDTNFLFSTRVIESLDLDKIGLTDNVYIVIHSDHNINNISLRVGNDNIYFKWSFDIVIGRNDILLSQYGGNLDKLAYGQLKPDLKLSDIDITSVGIEGTINEELTMYISDIKLKPNTDNKVISSYVDAIEVPLNTTYSELEIDMSFVSYWGNDGAVFGDYNVEKTIIGLVSDDLSISVGSKSYGGFKLNVLFMTTGYKHSFDSDIPTFFDVDTVCSMNIKVYINYNSVVINVIFNGYAIFNRSVPNINLVDQLYISFITIGGGKTYLHPSPTSVSLCGKLMSFGVCISKGTEDSVELDKIMVDLGAGFVPISDVLPIDLGYIPSGGKVTIPTKTTSQNTNVNLNLLWSLNR